MRLVLGLTPEGQFFVTAEACILMPSGRETLHWATLFENEGQFLRLVVAAPLSEREMALVLSYAIRASSVPYDAPHPVVEVELNEEQFHALGLHEGVCVAVGSEAAAQEL